MMFTCEGTDKDCRIFCTGSTTCRTMTVNAMGSSLVYIYASASSAFLSGNLDLTDVERIEFFTNSGSDIFKSSTINVYNLGMGSNYAMREINAYFRDMDGGNISFSCGAHETCTYSTLELQDFEVRCSLSDSNGTVVINETPWESEEEASDKLKHRHEAG